MTASFNLIDEHWIPCICSDGTRVELGLRETLTRAQDLSGIYAESPVEIAALTRLLLAVLHRVFGPRGRPEWQRLWQSGKFDNAKLDDYWRKWQHRFDVFDSSHPFYQARYSGAKEKSVVSLVLAMASGNNPTLFDHHTDEEGAALSPAQATRGLVAAQAFGIGGLSGMSEKFTDAPCAKGILFFAVGHTLFETLILNLLKYSEDDPIPNPNEDDCPAWEMENPFKPKRSKPKGYLDYLTWQNRRIWLIPEESPNGVTVRQMTWGPGLRLEVEDDDSMKRYYQDKKEGWRILSFDADRALWRDSAPLFQLNDEKNRPPKVVRWLSDLANFGIIPATHSYRLMALGMAKDQAKIEFFRSEVLPLPMEYLQDEKQNLVGDLSEALESAENIGRLLRSRFPSAIFTLARLSVKPGTGHDEIKRPPSSEEEKKSVANLANSWSVERYYWSGLELHFHRLVKDLPSDSEKALGEWREQVRRAARFAFERAEEYAGQNPRAQRAIVKAREQFDGGLNDYVPYQAKGEKV